jgi:hypothetical protein
MIICRHCHFPRGYSENIFGNWYLLEIYIQNFFVAFVVSSWLTDRTLDFYWSILRKTLFPTRMRLISRTNFVCVCSKNFFSKKFCVEDNNFFLVGIAAFCVEICSVVDGAWVFLIVCQLDYVDQNSRPCSRTPGHYIPIPAFHS